MNNPKIDLKYFESSSYEKIRRIIDFSAGFIESGLNLSSSDFEKRLKILGEQINCCGAVRDSLKKGGFVKDNN